MSDGRIALCLSGGGLRATLFHLGVVRALRCSEFEGESALKRVSEIYSVSGGSILAAHMLLKWDDYIGDDEAFAKVEAEILGFVGRNIRDRVLRRSALTVLPLKLWNLVSSRYVSGRAHWLMGQYKHLFNNARFDECVGEPGKKPRFHILATDFKTGELCSFSGDRFEVERREEGLIDTSCAHLTLTRAVASSSAFPPLFPPLVFDDRLLARPRGNDFLQPLLLSDGGVYDNLGIAKFWRNKERNPEAPGTLIISNAGSPFRAEAAKNYAGPLSRNVRASDILMHRVGDHAEREIDKATDVDDIVVRLTDDVPGGTFDDATQQPLRLVRTDLDRFGEELSRMLIEQGENVARQAFEAKGWRGKYAAKDWPDSPTDRKRRERIALNAGSRSFWMLPFDVRDWAPLLLLWAIAGFTVWGASELWLGYRNAKAAEAAAEVQAKKDQEELLQTKIDQLSNVNAAFEEGDVARARRLVLAAIGKSEVEQEEIREELTVTPAVSPSPIQVALPAQQAGYGGRVYIQFAGTIRREQIVALNRELRDNDWNVQGASGERIATAGGLNEVRFGGDNREAAQRLARAISAAGITSKPVEARENAVVGPTNLEVWISN